MEPVLILAPVLFLAVVALLGFAGCQLVFPAEPAGSLTLRVRVPSQLTIVAAQFRWIEPASTTFQTTTELERTDDGSGTTILSQEVTEAPVGSWMVNCRMQVADGSGQAADSIEVTFILDDANRPGTADFQTVGRPVTGDFAILFTGLSPG